MKRSSKKRRKRGQITGLLWGVAGCCVWLWVLWQIPAVPEAAAVPPPEPVRQTRQEVYTRVVPFRTVYTPDDSLPAGTERELTPGRDGEVRCTAQVEYLDGAVASRVILSEEPVRPVQNRQAAQGPMPVLDAPVIRDGWIQLPDGTRLHYLRATALTVSAYTHTDLFRSETTALGTAVHPGTAAADPAGIPFGTRMYVTDRDGKPLGIFRAEDSLVGTEGAELALYFPTAGACMDFGKQECMVYFLG